MTGEELASVTDTQKDGLEQAVQAASAAFPIWSSKTWNERSVLLANALEELKAHTDELRTILTAENGRPYRVAQWEIIRLFDTYVPTLPRVELQDLTWNEPGDRHPFHQMPPQNGNVLFRGVALPSLLPVTSGTPRSQLPCHNGFSGTSTSSTSSTVSTLLGFDRFNC